mgnify:CR=1 FL=1
MISFDTRSDTPGAAPNKRNAPTSRQPEQLRQRRNDSDIPSYAGKDGKPLTRAQQNETKSFRDTLDNPREQARLLKEYTDVMKDLRRAVQNAESVRISAVYPNPEADLPRNVEAAFLRLSATQYVSLVELGYGRVQSPDWDSKVPGFEEKGANGRTYKLTCEKGKVILRDQTTADKINADKEKQQAADKKETEARDKEYLQVDDFDKTFNEFHAALDQPSDGTSGKFPNKQSEAAGRKLADHAFVYRYFSASPQDQQKYLAILPAQMQSLVRDPSRPITIEAAGVGRSQEFQLSVDTTRKRLEISNVIQGRERQERTDTVRSSIEKAKGTFDAVHGRYDKMKAEHGAAWPSHFYARGGIRGLDDPAVEQAKDLWKQLNELKYAERSQFLDGLKGIKGEADPYQFLERMNTAMAKCEPMRPFWQSNVVSYGAPSVVEYPAGQFAWALESDTVKDSPLERGMLQVAAKEAGLSINFTDTNNIYLFNNPPADPAEFSAKLTAMHQRFEKAAEVPDDIRYVAVIERALGQQESQVYDTTLYNPERDNYAKSAERIENALSMISRPSGFRRVASYVVPDRLTGPRLRPLVLVNDTLSIAKKGGGTVPVGNFETNLRGNPRKAAKDLLAAAQESQNPDVKKLAESLKRDLTFVQTLEKKRTA